jgi:hypothetical protein
MAQQMLALQRSVGNAQVSRLVARQRTKRKGDAEAKRLTELERRVKRVENQQKATNHLASFRDSVMARAAGWEIAILNVGSAYAVAAKNHTDAVEAKKKVDAIKSQLMFSVLTVATAGSLAWLSGAVQASKEAAVVAGTAKALTEDQKLLVNVLEDTVQAFGGEVFSANGPGISQRLPSADQTTVSEDPLVFQNQRLARLKKDVKRAHLYFKEMNDALRTATPEQWDNYDERQQVAGYDAWLKQADLLSAGDDLPKVEVMAAELERGFWAKWAPALKETWTEWDPEEGPMTRTIFKSPGSAIEERWDKLGITKASGVGDFGWFTSPYEIEKVVDWASRYRVKSFV